ncbi:hypothetical protein SB394_07445 [Burkholderia sp. BCCIQ04A]|uniref:Lipoprotein n=1 Tax=Burkholderia anthinoferrum TaxID=3090833 RepID=A0ABU5WGK6_9BURK|nr:MULTISPECIES: hypothetical protein [Burkholderia]MCA8109335.1 hypothetical protein [Burkholderia sp. AU36459]MEB2530538.1 hypothetical protein [Burkholderia anthinoferrum]MEB2559359.1 hypothetical protein [Burkholderia anthinoferrum]MEB2578107.1 hypothetical protein [Burkholderia anthinoferrum]MDF3101548.1 hypothetical protein [Burkholderia semiarida]
MGGSMRAGFGVRRWYAGAWRVLAVLVVALVASGARAQSSALAANIVVCGPQGLAGVTYVSAAGQSVSCGTDANGNALVLQMSTQLIALNANDTTDDGGVVVGSAIGAAVLGVLAVAYGFRVVRNWINSSSEG